MRWISRDIRDFSRRRPLFHETLPRRAARLRKARHWWPAGRSWTSIKAKSCGNCARTFGTLNLASRSADGFSAADIEFEQQVAAQIAIAVENALAFKEIDVLKDKLAVEKLYLEEEIRTEFNFEEIIGESAPLKRALAQVELVAPAGTTVLILADTGTGK